MRITYDAEVDVLRIRSSAIPIEKNDEEMPGRINDNDNNGIIVNLEVLDTSTRMEHPRAVEYSVAG